MRLFEWLIWLINTAVAAAVSYYVVEWLKTKGKISDKEYRRYAIMVVLFVLSFIVGALIVSPKARDTARAILTGDRCYFSSITAPDGATREIDAQSHKVPSDTPITWEPNDCVMVVQAYQNHDLLSERKGQLSNKVVVQDVAFFSGITEMKIFRDGFYTESDNIWIEVVR